ncbi:MAG: hypothetical protein EOO93_03405, partial [Pedobacter sp.]
MLKKISKLTFFTLLSVTAVAQNTTNNAGTQTPQRNRNAPRPYSITIDNKTKVNLDTAKINAAFK